MRSGMRFGLSATEKDDVWSHWKPGQSLHEIGRAFEKPHSCICANTSPRHSMLLTFGRSLKQRVVGSSPTRLTTAIALTVGT